MPFWASKERVRVLIYMSSEKTETVSTPAEAPAPDISLQLMTFFEVNKKQIGMAVVIASVVAVIGYAYNANLEKKQLEASTALALVDLNAAAAAGKDKSPEPKADDFFKVATDFSGTGAAQQALIRGAVTLFDTGKFGDAQKKFEEFVATYPDSIVKPTAELGIAASLEAQKQLDKAAQSYQTVINAYATQSIATQAKLGLASVHEQKGEADKALKLYDEVAQVRPGTAPSGWVNEATTRKERLLAAHPDLAAQEAAKKAAENLPGVPSVTTPAIK